MTDNCETCGLPPDLCICKEQDGMDAKVNVNIEVKETPDGSILKAVATQTHLIDRESGDVTFRAIMQDESGKGIEITVSNKEVQKLIREALPTEEQRMQALLDKIHSIRVDRVLSVEDIDKRLTNLLDDVKKEFDKTTTQTEIKRCEAMFRVKLAIITQKRHIAKFSIQEESELSLALAKLKHKGD